MPSSGLQSIWVRLPSTDVLGFTHIVPQGGTSGFHDTLWNPGAPSSSKMGCMTEDRLLACHDGLEGHLPPPGSVWGTSGGFEPLIRTIRQSSYGAGFFQGPGTEAFRLGNRPLRPVTWPEHTHVSYRPERVNDR